MRRIAIALIGSITLLAASCGERRDRKVIGVSLLTKEHVFYRDLEKALRETAARHDFELIINSVYSRESREEVACLSPSIRRESRKRGNPPWRRLR